MVGAGLPTETRHPQVRHRPQGWAVPISTAAMAAALAQLAVSEQPGRDMLAETVRLSDGTCMDFLRSSHMAPESWVETRQYLESNPAEARKLAEYSTNPDKIRKQLSMRAIADIWQRQLDDGSEELSRKLRALEDDTELGDLFQQIRAYKMSEVKPLLNDDQLMIKVSRKMGGVPREAKPSLEKIRKNPITLQDACRNGDIKALEAYLRETESDPASRELEAKDHRGITCLGYAVGANRLDVAKRLLEVRADGSLVDKAGNSALHYAAGYGRQDMLDFLLGTGLGINQTNSSGQTPLAVATKNKQTKTIDLLKAKGASE